MNLPRSSSFLLGRDIWDRHDITGTINTPKAAAAKLSAVTSDRLLRATYP